MGNERKLLELKAEIDQAKASRAELEGKRKHLIGELESEWGCKTIKEAERELQRMEKEELDLSGKIQKGIQEVEEKFSD